MTPTNTPDALRLADKADSLAASLDKHARGWNDRMAFSEAMRCQADATEFRKCAAELRRLHAEVEKLRQGGEVVAFSLREAAMRDLAYLDGAKAGWNYAVSGDNDGFNKLMKGGSEAVSVLKTLHTSPPLQADEQRFKPPFANCRFQLCDLPGQCRAEGKCHHPAPLQADACKVPQGFDADKEQEAFEKEHDLFNLAKHPQHGFYLDKMTQSYWEGWIGRAMLSAAPTPNVGKVPPGYVLVRSPISEEMHVAAVKVLQRAPGIDGLPQRMLDAMLSASPAAPAAAQVAQPLTSDQLLNCASNIADSILFDLQGRKNLLDDVDEQVLQEIVAEHTKIILNGLAAHGIGKDQA